MKNIVLLLSALAMLATLSCESSGSSDPDQEDYGIEGTFESDEPLGKADSAGRPGPSTSYDNTDTQVWAVKNQWEDVNTTAAKLAGVAWGANSGLNWNQKYQAWVASMERTAGYNTYYDTFTFKTPWGKTLPAPKLECAEVAIFLRITFASWYNLPFYIEAVDGERTRIFFGHFGARTISDRYKKTPLYRAWYRDYTSELSGKSNADIVAAWPSDAKLRSRGLYGGGDEQEFLGEGLLSGAYFDEIFLNKRVGHFLLLTLTYFGSMHMADSRNTYNLVPDAIKAGDILVERWQRTGIGHVMVVKSVEELPENKFEATIVSGSMPRRQPKWETPVASKDYFTMEETGGEGTNYDGDEYVKLGGGLKRWRAPKKVNGNWMNTWMAADEASWICDTDWDRLKVRPTSFESLLGEVDPVDKRNAIIQQIEDARNHLRNYPASCSARERREKAFAKLYEVNAASFSMDKLATDTQYRTMEDYIFAELVYSRSKTCCWNSSTAAMHQIVMDYNSALQEESQQCLEPVVFMNNNGYEVFRAYAEETGRGGLWKPWSADESCPQADVAVDTEQEHSWSRYCDVYDDKTPVEPTCEDDALEDNDTPAQARSLIDSQFTGLIICENDDDWYSLQVTAGTVSTLSVSFIHADGDLDLSLHDAEGTQIASSTSVSDTETVDLSGLSDGTYLIRVFGYNGAANTYSMTIE